MVASGCGDGLPNEPAEDEAEAIVGIWDFVETMVISSHLVVCQDTGSIRFENDGDSLIAVGERTGTCSGGLGSYPVTTAKLALSDIWLSDGVISFTVKGGCGCDFGGCIDAQYVGTLTEGPPGQIDGSSACSINYDGSWHARAAAPLASIEIIPESSEMLVGETILLRPVMLDEMGARVFERSLLWSTPHASLIAVSDSGTVLGRQAGVATIAVEAEGLAAEATVQVADIELASVQAGAYHTCALTTEGEAYCWGANDRGQAGPAPSLYPCPGVECRPAPGRVQNLLPLSQVAAGFLHSCGLVEGGTAACWGSNSTRQLGQDGAIAGSSTPLAVPGNSVFSALTAGSNHTCALDTDGLASCWGLNNRAQLGSDAGPGTVGPTPVSGGLLFTSAAGGEFHTCGLIDDGTAYCWGWNWFQQLGVDSIEASSAPVPVTGGYHFTSLSAGAEHNCALDDAGIARCWGRGLEGQLGIEPVEYLAAPAEVTGGHMFASLSSGGRHACGVTGNGVAYCWGAGSFGQLGNGRTDSSFTPVAVAGGDLQFKYLTSGQEHTCGITRADIVYCWGSNYTGQLGITDFQPHPTPQRVSGQR